MCRPLFCIPLALQPYRNLVSHTVQHPFGEWLQTMGEPQPLSSAEKRRRTALAEKDYAAVVSAGGHYGPTEPGSATCCRALLRCSRHMASPTAPARDMFGLTHSIDVEWDSVQRWTSWLRR
jgi:hypothetical protein